MVISVTNEKTECHVFRLLNVGTELYKHNIYGVHFVPRAKPTAAGSHYLAYRLYSVTINGGNIFTMFAVPYQRFTAGGRGGGWGGVGGRALTCTSLQLAGPVAHV